MKKSLLLILAGTITMGMLVTSCKKTDPKDLEYRDIRMKNYLQAGVKQKKDGKTVLWFQVFDKIDDKNIINNYKSTHDRVDKYPALIQKNKWIWMLVNNRFEIRLIAQVGAKDFENTDELITFIKRFDLAGLEKVTGPKLKPEELVKFIPVLGGNNPSREK